jgi:hypothetical protein
VVYAGHLSTIHAKGHAVNFGMQVMDEKLNTLDIQSAIMMYIYNWHNIALNADHKSNHTKVTTYIKKQMQVVWLW